MGCTASIPEVHVVGMKRRKKKIMMNIPEVVVYVPQLRIPVQCDLHRGLRGLVPLHLVERLSSIRNRIVLVAGDTDGSAIAPLHQALDEYLPILLGLTSKDMTEHGLQELVEFKWKNLEDGQLDSCIANSWFELLSVVYMMAILTLSEANSLLIPKDHGNCGERIVPEDCMKDAVDMLLKASGYLAFCTQDVLFHLPLDIKKKLPKDLQGGVLEAISFQTLGQGTEMQLGLAAESQNASLPVKRRLACEQLSYYGQAHYCLSGCDINHKYGKKHLLFIKYKYLEAKAAAYYYHGLILDKGNEPSCRVSALCCFLAAEELLANGKKACLCFCIAVPVTRAPPLWGIMKHLHRKIPEVASRKYQMFGYLLEQEKYRGLHTLPDLPEFHLSLRPDDYELPDIDPAWDWGKWETQSQTLKQQLKDCGDEIETE